MSIPFVSRLRKDPRTPTEAGKFYPAASYIAEINVSKLASEISDNTTLTPTEVIGVIQSFLTTIPKYMMLGYKVRLDGFGIFKLGLINGCKGHEKAVDVTANDIKGLKILFRPDGFFKLRMDKPEYVKLDAKYLEDKGIGTGGGTDNQNFN